MFFKVNSWTLLYDDPNYAFCASLVKIRLVGPNGKAELLFVIDN